MTLATVDVIRKTGASPGTATAITSSTTRASTSDSPTPGANNPIPVPGAGTAYSYWLTTRLNVVANPDGHTINNLKWYAATSSVPSGTTFMGQAANVGADAGYRVATGTPGVSGTVLNTTNHTGLTGAPVDVFTFTSAAPKALAGSTASTGQVGDHVVMQIGLDPTVTPATPAPANTFRFRYDEA